MCCVPSTNTARCQRTRSSAAVYTRISPRVLHRPPPTKQLNQSIPSKSGQKRPSLSISRFHEGYMRTQRSVGFSFRHIRSNIAFLLQFLCAEKRQSWGDGVTLHRKFILKLRKCLHQYNRGDFSRSVRHQNFQPLVFSALPKRKVSHREGTRTRRTVFSRTHGGG